MQNVQVFKITSNFLGSHSCRETFYEGSVHQAPFFLNVDYGTGRILNHWVDSLSASFAAVQVRGEREGEREKEREREREGVNEAIVCHT